MQHPRNFIYINHKKLLLVNYFEEAEQRKYIIHSVNIGSRHRDLQWGLNSLIEAWKYLDYCT